MIDQRPDPDELLHRLQARESQANRGKLKIFLGYAAGVGKTYAMLNQARQEKAAGVKVVVGYVEPHGREETETLLEGLELLPLKLVSYHGVNVREFDLDQALARKPQLILVDELAHTNAEGLRHTKRWQDIEELLEAGIDVWTTCNVQHIESLNDVVAKITGIVMRETVPDDVFSKAHELVLIDIPPEELLERLRLGKVYVPQQAQRALGNFFKRENLAALREMALRRTADHVHSDVELARISRGTTVPWETRECLMVCISPSPTSARVIRSAKRVSNALQAELVAVHVKSTSDRKLAPTDENRLADHLRLAERLGAETVTLTGDDPVMATMEYARRRNVTKIVIGKSVPTNKHRWSKPTLTDRLIQDSGEIDVLVVRGVAEASAKGSVLYTNEKTGIGSWLGSSGILFLCTVMALAWNACGLTEANIVMTLLLGIVIISARYGFWPSIVSSILAVVLFDVFFTKPYYTVVVNDSQYVVTFSVMLIVGMTIVALNNRIRRQAQYALQNERRTEALYRLSRKLAGITGLPFLALETEKVIAAEFGGEVALLLPENGRIVAQSIRPGSFATKASEIVVAQWTFDHSEIAGRKTDTLPLSEGVYFPLASPHGTIGVLGIRHDRVEDLLTPDSRSLLEAYATLIALALERDRLTIESHNARVQAETQELRSSLLASVSHDIRTPLAVIAGASSSLLHENQTAMDEQTKQELLSTIFDESARLTQLVENLLRLTQLSSGAVQIHREWHPVEDVVGTALHSLNHVLKQRSVTVHFPSDLLMGYFDEVLLQLALINLLENAARYTPVSDPIEIRGRQTQREIILEVADRGPGLDPEELETIFESFQRGQHAISDSRGAGLGLAICRAIAKLHGGTIVAENREGGGALFRLLLPSDNKHPRGSGPLERSLTND
ncbi:DUF4118 domain-containing protein [Pirellulaceae bacterium SH449]